MARSRSLRVSHSPNGASARVSASMVAILQQLGCAGSRASGGASFLQKEASDGADPPTMVLQNCGEEESANGGKHTESGEVRGAGGAGARQRDPPADSRPTGDDGVLRPRRG